MDKNTDPKERYDGAAARPNFIELMESQENEESTAVKRQRDPRPSTKGARYDTVRIERSIQKRVRTDGTGKPSYDVQIWVDRTAVSKTFHSLRSARRWRDEQLGDRSAGRIQFSVDRRVTVAQFVSGDWNSWLEEQLTFGNLRPSTVDFYRHGSRRLVARLGQLKVADISEEDLYAMLSHQIKNGDSSSVIRQLRAATKSVLKLAIKRKILITDPSGAMSGDHAPRVPAQAGCSVAAWSEKEVQSFLVGIDGDQLTALWILFLGTGLRRGEALGLSWDDLDFDDGTVSVSRSLNLVDGVPALSKTKTQKSNRTIAVGASVLEALRSHRKQQASEELAATDWQNHQNLIFTDTNGHPLRPDFVTRRFKKIVALLDLPWIRLHGLRHTHASLLIQAGVDVATVSARLGHSDASITMSIYAHGSAESDRAAAEVLDLALCS